MAARLRAPGVDETDVWATNRLTVGEGSILSVDGFAQQFTMWPKASKSEARISPGDAGVQAARDCLWPRRLEDALPYRGGGLLHTGRSPLDGRRKPSES